MIVQHLSDVYLQVSPVSDPGFGFCQFLLFTCRRLWAPQSCSQVREIKHLSSLKYKEFLAAGSRPQQVLDSWTLSWFVCLDVSWQIRAGGRSEWTSASGRRVSLLCSFLSHAIRHIQLFVLTLKSDTFFIYFLCPCELAILLAPPQKTASQLVFSSCQTSFWKPFVLKRDTKSQTRLVGAFWFVLNHGWTELIQWFVR